MTYLKLKDKKDYLFLLMGLCVVGAGLYHLYAIFYPEIRPGFPWQRHLFWVFANPLIAFVIVVRRWFFIPVIVLFFVQQLYAHGGGFLSVWEHTGKISYLDLVVVLFMPVLLVAYVRDTLEGFQSFKRQREA